jgi:hypothetical protein
MIMIDITNQKFGRLVAIRPVDGDGKGQHWLCKCDCGNEKVVDGRELRRGKVRSCGCYAKEIQRESAKKNLQKLRNDGAHRHGKTLKDLIGIRFDRLVVLRRGGQDKYGKIKWWCRCDCGNEVEVFGDMLCRNRTKSCGCLQKELADGAVKDLKGQRFGRWLVIEESYSDRGRCWLCRCDCGNERIINGYQLRSGQSQSCGCLILDLNEQNNVKHGENRQPGKSKEYKVWDGIIQRCTNSNDWRYVNYGGRGIKVCDRWRYSFEKFLEDMGRCPEGMSIDRININGDYCPNNCRWASQKEQQRNKTTNVYVMIFGVKMIMADLLRYLGIAGITFYNNKRRFGLNHQETVDLLVERYSI